MLKKEKSSSVLVLGSICLLDVCPGKDLPVFL